MVNPNQINGVKKKFAAQINTANSPVTENSTITDSNFSEIQCLQINNVLQSKPKPLAIMHLGSNHYTNAAFLYS